MISRRNLMTTMRGIVIAAALPLFGTAPVFAQAKPGHITVAIQQDIFITDPHRATSGIDFAMFANVYEGLVGIDDTGKLVPELATEWTADPNGKVYNFKLREGVTFHNGDPFTAEDVVFSWQRAKDPVNKNVHAGTVAERIASIDVKGPYEITITLDAPDYAFLENINPHWLILPKKYIETIGSQNFADKPIGSGPFKFVSRSVGSSMEFEAFKEHWGHAPKIDSVTMKVVPDDSARIAMLKTGEADMVQNVPPFMKPELDAGATTKTVQVEPYMMFFIGLNSQSPVFNLKLRQALNHAIDKQVIADKLYFGAIKPLTKWCVSSVVGCEPIGDGYAYDPEKAKQLVIESGYDTSRPIRFWSMADNVPHAKELAEALVHFFTEIGLKVDLSLHEYGTLLAFRGAEVKDYTQHDMMQYRWSEHNSDPLARLQRVVGKGGSASFYDDPTLNALLEKAKTATTEEIRTQTIHEAFQYINDQALVVPMFTLNSIWGMRKDLEWKPRAGFVHAVLWTLEEGK